MRNTALLLLLPLMLGVVATTVYAAVLSIDDVLVADDSHPIELIIFEGFSVVHYVEVSVTHPALHLYINGSSSSSLTVNCTVNSTSLVPLGLSLLSGNASRYEFPGPSRTIYPQLVSNVAYPVCSEGAQVTGIEVLLSPEVLSTTDPSGLSLVILQEVSPQSDQTGDFDQQPIVAFQHTASGRLLTSVPLDTTIRAEWYAISPIGSQLQQYYDLESDGTSAVNFIRHQILLRNFKYGYRYQLEFSVLAGSLAGTSGLNSTVSVTSADCSETSLWGKFSTKQCILCPTGLSCDGTERSLVEGSYWRHNNRSAATYSCEPPYMVDSCRSGTETGTCVEGHTGPRCSVCEPGYGFGEKFCSQCPSLGASIGWVILFIIAMLMVIMMLVAVTMRCAKADRLPIFVKITVNHFVVASIIGEFFEYVPSNALAVVQLQRSFSRPNPRTASMDCATGFTWYNYFIAVNVLPIVLSLVIGLTLTFLKKRSPEEEEEDEQQQQSLIADGSGGDDTTEHLINQQQNSVKQNAKKKKKKKKETKAERQRILMDEFADMEDFIPLAPAAEEETRPLLAPASDEDDDEDGYGEDEDEDDEDLWSAGGSDLQERSAHDDEDAAYYRSQSRSASHLPRSRSHSQSQSIGGRSSFGDGQGSTMSTRSRIVTVKGDGADSDDDVEGGGVRTVEVFKRGKNETLEEIKEEEIVDDFDLGKQQRLHVFAVTTIVVLFLLYPAVVEFCTSSLKCDVIDETVIEDDGSITGGKVSYFFYARQYQCDSEQHQTYQLLGIIFGVMWGIGTPVIALSLFHRLRRPVELGGIGKANASRLFTFLVAGYRKNVWWWEGTIMMRKVAMIMILNFVTTPALQTLTSIWVIMTSLITNVLISPYSSPSADSLERVSLVSLALSLNLGLLLDILLGFDLLITQDDAVEVEVIKWLIFCINVGSFAFLCLVVLMECVEKLRRLLHEHRAHVIEEHPTLEGCVRLLEFRPKVRFVYDKHGRAIKASQLTEAERDTMGIDVHEEEPDDWSDSELDEDEDEAAMNVPQFDPETGEPLPLDEEIIEQQQELAIRGFNFDGLQTYDPMALNDVGGEIGEAIIEQERTVVRKEDQVSTMKDRLAMFQEREAKAGKKLNLVSDFSETRGNEEMQLVQGLINTTTHIPEKRALNVERKRRIMSHKLELNQQLNEVDGVFVELNPVILPEDSQQKPPRKKKKKSNVY